MESSGTPGDLLAPGKLTLRPITRAAHTPPIGMLDGFRLVLYRKRGEEFPMTPWISPFGNSGPAHHATLSHLAQRTIFAPCFHGPALDPAHPPSQHHRLMRDNRIGSSSSMRQMLTKRGEFAPPGETQVLDSIAMRPREMGHICPTFGHPGSRRSPQEPS
jgi:hypothetical protein